MRIAILTFDGFNELDSLIAYGMQKDAYVDRALQHITPHATEITA